MGQFKTNQKREAAQPPEQAGMIFHIPFLMTPVHSVDSFQQEAVLPACASLRQLPSQHVLNICSPTFTAQCGIEGIFDTLPPIVQFAQSSYQRLKTCQELQLYILKAPLEAREQAHFEVMKNAQN